MKKLLFVLLTLALVLGCAAVLGETTYKSAGFEYFLMEDGNAELIRYLGTEDAVTIPNELDGHPITRLRGNPFLQYGDDGAIFGVLSCTVSVSADHPCLTTVDGLLVSKEDGKLIYCSPATEGACVIPQGITVIGDLAFLQCDKLTAVTIPEGVMSIGGLAFDECSALERVTIPGSVSVIGWSAFEECGALTSVTIPEGVEVMGSTVFAGCTALTSATLPESLKSMGEHMFAGCTGLTVTVIPGSYAETWCKENGVKYVTSGAE